ncbi:hypothetical protein MC7420_3582 [Coleofasciculus chthonoplastes PCC 7420]|uniref:Uncharacterized protein n=1 Tax=Coleofasciculus chthonoplastes PCC 7420 TaxID=118168 RepID=B4W033_9CYAN|nr:hypothetical protein MC7420_3582 [Coleofasciculus chthonoplastes PCC 7420]
MDAWEAERNQADFVKIRDRALEFNLFSHTEVPNTAQAASR